MKTLETNFNKTVKVANSETVIATFGPQSVGLINCRRTVRSMFKKNENLHNVILNFICCNNTHFVINYTCIFMC